MGILNHFPWSDEHQLNLDWILRLLTSFKGGAVNQVLAKKSNKDYDFKWVNQSGGGGGGTSDYNDLSNKPSINSVELSGNKTAAQLGLGTYSKPVNGIPKTDFDSSVQSSLGKADTALQSVPSTYRTAAAQDVIDAGKADKITEVTIGTAGAVTQALDAEKIYHFTGALTSLAITLNPPRSGQLAQYHFDFESGSTPPTVTLPGTVRMAGGTFTPEASKRYEIDILNGYGLSQNW